MSVVDDFLEDPDAMRAFALGLEYRADPRYFRGVRSTTVHPWPCVKEAVEQLLGGRVADWERDNPINGVFQLCVAGDQLVYHSDHNTHAAVLYLTPNAPPQAGTTIHRSRHTRGRTVDESKRIKDRDGSNLPPAWFEKQMYEGKLLDRTAWEPVDVIGNVYNRLTVWDARMVHSASEYFGHDLRTGRLFNMFFFNMQ